RFPFSLAVPDSKTPPPPTFPVRQLSWRLFGCHFGVCSPPWMNGTPLSRFTRSAASTDSVGALDPKSGLPAAPTRAAIVWDANGGSSTPTGDVPDGKPAVGANPVGNLRPVAYQLIVAYWCALR